MYTSTKLVLPEFSARVYRELLRGLYAEPGFSDVTESDIARTLTVQQNRVHGAVCKLIKAGLVRFYDMQTSEGEEILYATIWRGDEDDAQAAKADHLHQLDVMLGGRSKPEPKLAEPKHQPPATVGGFPARRLTEVEMAQRAIYGHTVEEIEADVARAAGDPWKMSREAYCISLLSDVQEMIAFGGAEQLEKARQTVNVVKRVLSFSEESK